MDTEFNQRQKSRNRDKKDKDKKKKKKHQNRERSKSHKKKKNSEKQRNYDDQYIKDRAMDRDNQRSRQKQRDRYFDRDRERGRQRERQKSLNWERDKDREKSKSREKGRDRERQKEKQRERQREKEKQKQKQRQREREKQRERQKEIKIQKEKEKQRQKQKQVVQNQKTQQVLAKQQVPDVKEKDKEKEKQKQKQKESRQKSPKKKKKRDDSVDRKKSRRDRRSRSRSRRSKSQSRDRNKKKKKNNYDRHRSRRQKSYSSSSSQSRQGNISDDPEQVQKLAQMKAAKELVSSKADRKLYLGNLPPNITSQQLMDMLNGALKKMEINTETEGDSIVSAWISPDGVGHYAFVQFRTAQEATNGLTLNGASLFGYQLKLGRPKQYIEYNKTLLSELGTDKNMETIMKKVAALGVQTLPDIEQIIICPPSKIVALKYIVSIEQLAIDEQYQQIYEDVLEMAKRFGDVINIVIPRPHQAINLHEIQGRVKGLGLILIEYKDIGQAKYARNQFITKEFSGHPVACSFFDEQRFRNAEYDIQQRVIIDF